MLRAANELWTYRAFIYNLAQRDLRARYKKSLLGSLWSLINPASTLVIYTVVFGVILRIQPPPAANGTTVFALYLFAGLVIWNFFSATVNGAMAALNASGGLLNKVYFPAACPPIANEAVVLSQTGIELGILAVAVLIVGNASATMLLIVPTVALLALFSLGVGLAVSVFNVYYRDISYLVGIMLNVWFYATPVVYPITLVPEEVRGIPLRRIFELNPLTQFVELSREAFYFNTVPSLARVTYVVVWTLVVFALGWMIFERKARDLAEEL
jgi:ABC-2 type transport system permease protein